jgi:hypothetical protein
MDIDKLISSELPTFNLADLNTLQEALTEAIAAQRQATKTALLDEFKQKVEESGLSLDEVLVQETKAKKGKTKASGLHAPEQGVTYKNPADSSQTWSTGTRGPKPGWVRAAIEDGSLGRLKG